MTSNIPLSDSALSTNTQKSAAPTERSSFSASEAPSDTPQAHPDQTQALSQRVPWWRSWKHIFSATVLAVTVSHSLQHGTAGDVINAGLLVGTGWLFLIRFRRLGFRIWLPVVTAFVGFNIYSFFMSGVLHWGEAAYHLMLFFGSVTALLFYIGTTLLLPNQKPVVLPELPSRTELAIELAKEEQARLLQQDKTEDPQFMVWQLVLERYQRILDLEQGSTST
ncbi:hypothetical protein N836_00285 [Leptolyngbya sp. Heron Island J]|nr:hypothetical protein N836_00285 [Leptolyngbya sp. Heron Island J]